MRLLEEGRRIGDNYEVERFLGEGAFAEVYRVRHRFFGRQALKVFKRTGTMAETEDMLGEAILLSQIGHPNIVRVFNADIVPTPRGQYGFFTMEYVAGGNLQNFWISHRNRFVPIDVAVRILRQISEGIGVAHLADPPIIHRDITPQNILVGYDAEGIRARVSDFGLAKRLDPLVMLASTKGTLAFKAPESLIGRGDSPASDVWAIGTIAYLLLTDTLPYEDDGPTSFFGTQHRVPPLPPHRFNPDVDEELDRIVLEALDPDPASRIPNAGALAADLMSWQATHSHLLAKHAVDLPKQTSKNVLGRHSPVSEEDAKRLAKQALSLGRQAATLPEADDAMEEAFNTWADLRAEHEWRLRLWRKGVVT